MRDGLANMIDKKYLKPGDILLYRVVPRSGFSAKFISWGQHVLNQAPSEENYCHIAIVDNDTDYILEAKWPKVRRWKLDWEHLDASYHVELWRVKKVTPKKVQKALAWATEHLGEWYDLPLFFFGLFNFRNAEICSTYVQHAYENAKIQLSVEGPGKNLTTPDEIAANTKVIKRII